MAGWTYELVKARIKEAVRVYARLAAPDLKARLALACGPRATEVAPWAQGQRWIGSPSAEAIDRADAAMAWLAWLDGTSRDIVLARAGGRPWWAIASRHGAAERTLRRAYDAALDLIVASLNETEGDHIEPLPDCPTSDRGNGHGGTLAP